MQILQDLRSELQSSANPENQAVFKRFYKEGEEPLTYGVKASELNNIAKGYLKKIKTFFKKEIFELCEELWKSGYHEEALVACSISESIHRQYEPNDFKIFEHWVSTYVRN